MAGITFTNFVSDDEGKEIVTSTPLSANGSVICPSSDVVDTYTAISEKQVFSSGKQIYVQNAKDSNVRVYSILGNVVADKKADSNLFDLNIPVPGIYLVKVDSEIWKVVVE